MPQSCRRIVLGTTQRIVDQTRPDQKILADARPAQNNYHKESYNDYAK